MASDNGKKTAVFKPFKLSGSICAPPSKSFAHRMMICAALAKGKSTVSGIAESEDMLATLDCIRALGADCTLKDGLLTVNGTAERNTESLFPCRESGSTLRFFIPTALASNGRYTFTGTERLMSRGIGIYEDIFKEKNISVSKGDSYITVCGKLTPGEYNVKGSVSSQYITGLLLALPLLGEPSRIKIIPPVESRPYIDITVSVMKLFGVDVIEAAENEFFIPGGQHYAGRELCVEGDWSNAAFYCAFKAIGNEITVNGLNPNSIQGDKICLKHFKALEEADPVIDISDCPDLGPVLFALAAAKHGAVFTGTKRLKIKESDRAEAMAEELLKFGIICKVEENSVTVLDGELKAPCEPLSSHNDHRIVMALSILLSITGGTINGAEAVNKSYPDYFSHIKQLGAEVRYEA